MTAVPPHTTEQIGDPVDSVQNCLRLQPKAPKKDLKKFIKFSGKVTFFSFDFNLQRNLRAGQYVLRVVVVLVIVENLKM